MVISRQVFHTNTHSHTLTLTSSSPQRSRKNKTKAQRSALRDEINGETFFPRHANNRPIDERVPPQEHSRRLRLTHCSSETCHRGFATETGKLMKNLIQWTTHTHTGISVLKRWGKDVPSCGALNALPDTRVVLMGEQ